MKTVRSMMAILALAVSTEMGAQGIIRPKTTPAPNVTHTTPSKSKTQKRTCRPERVGRRVSNCWIRLYVIWYA